VRDVPRRLLFLTILLLVRGPAAAERLPFRSYTTEEGLPHNRVKRILADSHGFVWLCTTEGLSRFDGQAFVNYGMAEGLPVPSVNDLLEVEGKGYWVATNGGGAAFLDPNAPGRSRFTVSAVGSDPAAGRVNVLHRDRQGRLWAGTDGGLFRHDGARFDRIRLGLPGRPDEVVQVWALAEDDSGTVWAGTKYGLVGVGVSGVLQRAIAPRETDNVLALLADAQGRVWVGHESAGLLVYDAGALRAGGVASRRYTPREGLAGERVNALRRAGQTLWIGTQTGLSELSLGAAANVAPKTYTATHGLAEELVTALESDRDGNLWIGTAAAGAQRLARNGFVTYGEADGLGHSVAGIFERANGELVVTSTGWLISRFDGRRFTTVRPRLPESLPATRWRFFQTTLEDRGGEWWVATGEGLARFSRPRAFEELATRPPQAFYTTADGLAGDDVSQLYEDARGDVWIGTFTPVANGLTRFERATSTFHRYGRSSGLPELVSVTAFAEDAGGSLWIALRDGGLARFKGGAFHVFTQADGFPPIAAVDLLADPAGPLWASGNNLFRVEDPSGLKPHAAAYRAEGLDGRYLSALSRDADGILYVGTSRDVRRFDPTTGAVEPYSSGNGVVSSEVLAAHRDRSGALWFGTWRGLSRFVPAPEPLLRPPTVRIGAVALSGVSVPVSGLGAADVPLGELAASQDLLQIDFFSLGGEPGDAPRYQHLLEGAEHDWSAPASQRSIVYAKLAPGRYRFRVRAVNGRGLGSTTPAVVSFTVLPPVWRRWWFLLAAALLVGSVGYAADHARSARRLEVERVRTRIATDLHDDIGASLSRIAVLTEVLKKKVGPEHEERLSDIAELARELVGAMSDIVWATDPRRDDLRSVTRRLRTFASDLLEGRGIAFECRVSPECEDVKLGPEARRELYLILKEAVSNVARHSGATDARLRLGLEGRFLVAELHDDGRGVPPAGPLGSGFTHGTIHGIPNMEKRAQAAGGSFRMSSSPGEGTTVKLRIPVGRAT